MLHDSLPAVWYHFAYGLPNASCGPLSEGPERPIVAPTMARNSRPHTIIAPKTLHTSSSTAITTAMHISLLHKTSNTIHNEVRQWLARTSSSSEFHQTGLSPGGARHFVPGATGSVSTHKTMSCPQGDRHPVIRSYFGNSDCFAFVVLLWFFKDHAQNLRPRSLACDTYSFPSSGPTHWLEFGLLMWGGGWKINYFGSSACWSPNGPHEEAHMYTCHEDNDIVLCIVSMPCFM